VARDQGCAVASGAVGVQRPEQLAGRKAAGVDLDENVADGRFGVRGIFVHETFDAHGS
jgi:hypothetical protein